MCKLGAGLNCDDNSLHPKHIESYNVMWALKSNDSRGLAFMLLSPVHFPFSKESHE